MIATTEVARRPMNRTLVSIFTACLVTAAVSVVRAAPSPQLEEGLRLDIQVQALRRCYNDKSIATDDVSLRLVFTNVSSEPIAMVPGFVIPGRTRLWESSDGRSQQQLVLNFSPEPPLGAAPQRPPDEDLAVLWPGDSVAADRTVTVVTLRREAAPIAGVVRRARHLLSVTGYVRIAPYESDTQSRSTTRSVGFESAAVLLDLSVPLPLEFCR